jgi:hypothetical protein
MASSGMLRHVTLVRTGVSEELSSSFIRVTRIGELGKTLAVTSKRRRMRRNTTRRNIPEDTILHSHRRENLKSYARTHTHTQIFFLTKSTSYIVSISPLNCKLNNLAIATQRLLMHVPTTNNRSVSGHISLLLLGERSVNMLPLQRII